MKPNESSFVRAIDVGYGATKFVTAPRSNNGDLTCDFFPSVALPVTQSGLQSIGRQADVYEVPVGDVNYLVGKEIALRQDKSKFGREIGNNFSSTPGYQALTKGALRYIGLPHIDVLSLGLPVNLFLMQERVEELRNTYTGTIDLGQNHKVSVDRVMVYPQPMGGWLDSASNIRALNEVLKASGGREFSGADEFINENNVLVVDPGEYTLDWLVMRQGVVKEDSSGARTDSGRYRILQDVASALNNTERIDVPESRYEELDHAVNNGKPFKLAGQLHDLTKYKTVVDNTVSEQLRRMIPVLRGVEDTIDMIILVGGRSDLYIGELQKLFPNRPIYNPKNAIFSNVRGFQWSAEMFQKKAAMA